MTIENIYIPEFGKKNIKNTEKSVFSDDLNNDKFKDILKENDFNLRENGHSSKYSNIRENKKDKEHKYTDRENPSHKEVSLENITISDKSHESKEGSLSDEKDNQSDQSIQKENTYISNEENYYEKDNNIISEKNINDTQNKLKTNKSDDSQKIETNNENQAKESKNITTSEGSIDKGSIDKKTPTDSINQQNIFMKESNIGNEIKGENLNIIQSDKINIPVEQLVNLLNQAQQQLTTPAEVSQPLENQTAKPVEQLVNLLNQAQQQLTTPIINEQPIINNNININNSNDEDTSKPLSNNEINKSIFNTNTALIRDSKLSNNTLGVISNININQLTNNSETPLPSNLEANSNKFTNINEMLLNKETPKVIPESSRISETLNNNSKGIALNSRLSEFENSFNSNRNSNKNSFFNSENQNLNKQLSSPNGNNLFKTSEATFNPQKSQLEGEISLTRNIDMKMNPAIAKAENYNFQSSSFLSTNIDNSLSFSNTSNTINEILNNSGSPKVNRAIHTQTFLPIHEQIAVNISKAVGEGVNKIQIQLQPSDMGKVEIQLDVSREGRVIATVLADKPETLENLQRDSKSLERALQQAGLQTNSESLNFGLRDDQNGQLNPENQDSNENSLEEENSVVETLSGSIKSIPRPFGFSEGAIDLSV